MGTKFSLRPLVLLAMLTAGIAMAQQSAHPSSVVTIDHIVAVVNENVITRYELDEMLKTAVRQLQKQGVQPPEPAVLEKQLLERIILNRVQLQLAKETGVTVSDTELDQTLRRIAQENKMSSQEFHNALEQDGISFNKFRDEIRDEIILVRLKEREVNNRINVTEGEVDSFLHAQENSSDSSQHEYRLAHILVQLPEQADALKIQAGRQRAEIALGQLKSGAEFAKVAAEFSDAADAIQGGVLDWRPASQLTKKFAEILASMKPGELTDIIPSPNGFHILKLLDRRNQKDAITMVDQTHARHILIKINELTSETDARRRITELKERLDNGGNFEELARVHSQDASGSSGGDLGWVSPGDTVPEFEQAMNALRDGETSAPVQSPFGWHLIQVIERRSQDMSKERQRQSARQAIRARKGDAAFQEWLQRLRDRAYVEYRLEEG
ncbi:MAG: peptidylprolyl isomerase [Pseudomonadota bacterium]|nr:peptidylprolyl isomerase [Pseudomonadota bacterium]